jgi:serine protease Do
LTRFFETGFFLQNPVSGRGQDRSLQRLPARNPFSGKKRVSRRGAGALTGDPFDSGHGPGKETVMGRANWSRLVVLVGVAGLGGGLARGDDPASAANDPQTASQLYRDVFANHAQERLAVDTADGLSRLVFVQGGADNDLGAALAPVEESARAQLGLHKGQGLVVSNVAANGPAARVGLSANDILLSLGDKFLGKPEDLTAWLKAAGDKPVELHVLRAGKPLTLRVKPVYRVTLGVVPSVKRDYYIGVPVQAPDETLRAQLPDVPAGLGLVASEIQPDSPAAKAGLKPFDILLEFGGAPLKDTETLVARIQASEGKSTPVKLLRGGKPLTVQVTPEPRKDAFQDAANTWDTAVVRWVHPQQLFSVRTEPALTNQVFHLNLPQEPPASTGTPVEKRLEELANELKSLRKSVEDLQKSLKKQ